MLGEQVTTELSKTEKPTGMIENKQIAQRGGTVAGNARKETEKELNKSVISRNNHLILEHSEIKKKITQKKKASKMDNYNE